MTYPMPRDNVFLDPNGAVTTAPADAYDDEHDRSERLTEETANAEADDEGEQEARDEEARAEDGDEDDDAEFGRRGPDDEDADAVLERDEADSDVDARPYADERDAAGGDAVDEPPDTDLAPAGISQPVAVSDPVLDDDPAPESAETSDAPEAAGIAAAGAETEAVASGMHPGEADVPPAATMAGSADFRERWQQAQLSFIDDPRAAAESARSLAAEVLEAHISSLRDRQQQLDSWQTEATPDTEVLRAAMRAYRDTVNSLTD